MRVILLGCVLALIGAGCAPRATPTPTPQPAPTQTPGAPAAPVTTATLGYLIATIVASGRATASSQKSVGPMPATLAAPRPTPTPNPKPQAPVPPKAGDLAYEFTLNNLQGKATSLSSFRGKKVMLNFWATWCGPCRIEIPAMVKLYDEYQSKGFEIVAINLREDPSKVSVFVEQYKMRFPILLDVDARVSEAYFVRGIPTSVFLDDRGIIKAVHMGTLTEQTMRKYVEDLMR